MDGDRVRRARREVAGLSKNGLDWVSLATGVSDVIALVVPFDRSCWHTVDPGSVLFTGRVTRAITCSGTWLAEHEYVIEDVNKWWFLARSGRLAGATSLTTHGDLSRSARHRSHASYGIGDELRVSFVADGTYWAAAGFLRDHDQPWFTEHDVRFVTSLAETVANGLRRALVHTVATKDVITAAEGPGVIVFNEHGDVESISPAAAHWIAELVEEPPPVTPADSKIIQAVVARVRAMQPTTDPLQVAARARVQTRSGAWLLLYGTPLTGGAHTRTAVIIQPATPNEVAPLVALAYGLSDREREITRLCMQGHSTKEMAAALHVSPYTIQDHLKAIFDKTGVRTRNELVGQIFLEHYVTRWEDLDKSPTGWSAKAVL
ncbi:MAG: helix-turn-helix transcriptional regulator [Actinomycetota bacterium]|nr:helix-turn-helix transcriptional regulator [Actinomycetota bacterium]